MENDSQEDDAGQETLEAAMLRYLINYELGLLRSDPGIENHVTIMNLPVGSETEINATTFEGADVTAAVLTDKTLLVSESPKVKNLLLHLRPKLADIYCFFCRGKFLLDFVDGKPRYSYTDTEGTNVFNALFLNIFTPDGQVSYVFPYALSHSGDNVLYYEIDIPGDEYIYILDSVTPREECPLCVIMWAPPTAAMPEGISTN